MKLKLSKVRILVLAAVFCGVLAFFALKLVHIQIVEGENYRNISEQSKIVEQTIEAARGEIVDRNGKALAVNDVSFNIIIDRTFVESGQLNETIYSLAQRMSGFDEEWIDPLPISMQEPFKYDTERPNSVDALKNFLKINSNDPEDALYWLFDRYDLEEEPDREKARIIAGVRYNMELQAFSMSNPYTFATDVSMELGTVIMEHGMDYPGAMVNETTTRRYENGTLAPHILGQVGPIYQEELEYYLDKGYARNEIVGKSGIEKTAEQYLRGIDGTRSIEINSTGDVINAVVDEPATPGSTVVLTIDNGLQAATYQALESRIKWLNENAQPGRGKEANAGAAAVIDVKTGEILALVNYPSYDLNDYNKLYSQLIKDERNPLFDRVLSGKYIPGSIFKPAVSVGALAEGIIEPQSTVYCGHVYTVYEDYQPTCMGHHGDINVYGALQESCNIFFYDVGRRMGITNIEKYAKELGLGVSTGIELPEAQGQIINPELFTKLHHGTPWTKGNVLQAAIGQMDTMVTPLQLANYTATIANKGKRMDLNIIKSVEKYDYTKTLYTQPHDVSHQMDVDESVFDVVTEGMVRVSKQGTARSYFKDYPIDVACKTGTPQTSKETENATFTAFAPADDPQIAIAVVIEKGSSGTSGAPVTKDILDYYFQYTYTSEKTATEGVLLP